MATLFLPRRLTELTGVPATIDVEGATVRQLIANLERSYPGILDQLVEGDRLKPHISVAIDGVVRPLGVGCGLEPFPKHESRIFSTPGLALAGKRLGNHTLPWISDS